MWQKCPICNGTGKDSSVVGSVFNSYTCSTCQGMKIISEVTGLPPVSVPPTHYTSNVTVPKGTDFRDEPRESQDEYFGRK